MDSIMTASMVLLMAFGLVDMKPLSPAMCRNDYTQQFTGQLGNFPPIKVETPDSVVMSIPDFGRQASYRYKGNIGTLTWYGSYCGLGGQGTPLNSLDVCCQNHDQCWGDAEVLKNKHNRSCRPKLDSYEFHFDQEKNYYVCDDELNTADCENKICHCDFDASECFEENQYVITSLHLEKQIANKIADSEDFKENEEICHLVFLDKFEGDRRTYRYCGRCFEDYNRSNNNLLVIDSHPTEKQRQQCTSEYENQGPFTVMYRPNANWLSSPYFLNYHFKCCDNYIDDITYQRWTLPTNMCKELNMF